MLVHMVISLALLSVCVWVTFYVRLRAAEARVFVLQKNIDAMSERYAWLLTLAVTPPSPSSSGANKVVSAGRNYNE